MSEEQLYRRVISTSGRVRYVPHYPADDAPPAMHNINDRQALTIAASLGCALLIIFERHFPPHMRNARKIKAVEKAIIDLYHGSGEALDPEISEWVCKCWDETMRRAQELPGDEGAA